MLETKNNLSILYEGKKHQIPIGSSIKELEQEFINKFQAQKNVPYYFYYKVNNDIDIILTEDSFSDFVELNIMTLYVDKKKESTISDSDMTLSERNINSGLDLLIQEIKKEKTKIKKDKNVFIKSEEIELNYKLVKDNSTQNNLINDMKLKINELFEENNKLKTKKEKQNIIKETKGISFQYNGQSSIKKEIESLKNENNELNKSKDSLKEKLKNMKKELTKKNEDLLDANKKLTNENTNLKNEIKNFESIVQTLTNEKDEQIKKLKKDKKELKTELKELKAKNMPQSSGSSNNSSKIDAINKSGSSKKEIIKKEKTEKKKNKTDIINKFYQDRKEKRIYNSMIINADDDNNLDSSINEDLDSSQYSLNDKKFYELKRKNELFETFRKIFSKHKKNK